MNIGIDIDDTISETFETLLPYAQKYTIEDLKRESDINMNDNLLDHFYIVKMNKWNEDEAAKFWSKYYSRILKEVNIKKLASEIISKLRNEGHKIYLITARWDMRDQNVREITLQWLKDNNVEYDNFFMNAEDKLKLVNENNIDVFIDDSFNNCKKIAYESKAKVLLMNTQMNNNINDRKIKRVFSWPEIYYLINKK